MKFIETRLPGVVIVEPTLFGDERGYFMETFHSERFEAAGLPHEFVQDNQSRSARNVLRGLHYQEPKGQGKLVRAIRGSIFDVAVDVRRGSPNFGEWFGTELSEENRRLLWVPVGFAHGFAVLSESADVAYKCTALYNPQTERGLLWNDPAVGIDWPVSNPTLSEKDAIAPLLKDSIFLPQY